MYMYDCGAGSRLEIGVGTWVLVLFSFYSVTTSHCPLSVR